MTKDTMNIYEAECVKNIFKKQKFSIKDNLTNKREPPTYWVTNSTKGNLFVFKLIERNKQYVINENDFEDSLSKLYRGDKDMDSVKEKFSICLKEIFYK